MATPPTVIITQPIAAEYPDPWPRLFADVKIDIPGVTDAVFKQVLFRTWKDFCDKTNIWKETIPIEVYPPELTYTFRVNKGAPSRLILVYDPASASPDQHWVQGGISMSAPGTLQLRYAPSSVATWHVVVAKTPLAPTDTNNYPDMEPWDYWIVDKYRECLYYGTLGRLQASAAKPYSNTTLASFNLKHYQSELGKARTDAIKANVFGGQRWMYPQSFSTVRRGGWV
jgi:hypothetical protein